MDAAARPLDCWASWLMQRRQGGSEMSPQLQERLRRVRDQLLDNCGLRDSDVVLDVGCGDGLIGFGALERLGPGGRAIFSDISEDLLRRCTEIAEHAGVTGRCDFVRASADDLGPVPAESVDVVTTRSVLIYVADKPRALQEFHRVLRPGGRASIFEPINRFTWPEPDGFFYGYDLRPVGDLLAKVRAVYDRLEDAQRSMMDFDERDLLRDVEQAGFGEVHMQYRVDIAPKEPEDPERFLRSSGNPLAPTLEEAITEALSRDERERFLGRLSPLLEAGHGMSRQAVAFIAATKSPRG